MGVFVISEVRFVDGEAANRHVTLAEKSIARHGGRYLVCATAPDVPEGNWDEGRRVVVEFATMEMLKNWYASDDYAEALAIRQTALERRLLFVQGSPIDSGCRYSMQDTQPSTSVPSSAI